MPHALVVDRPPRRLSSVESAARDRDYTVTLAGDADAFGRALAERRPDVVLFDLRTCRDWADAAVSELERLDDMPRVVAIASRSGAARFPDALRRAAWATLERPLDVDRLARLLERPGEAAASNESARPARRGLERFGGMIGRSSSMRRLYEQINRVADTAATVLVVGETGTGKELVARAIHDLGPRADDPYVAVNCGAFTPTLIESELFGHEAGSFTGAKDRRKGCFEQADGGTLLLDEVTEMPFTLQVNLLRVLESGHVRRVGGEQSVGVDVRLIAATNRDPDAAVEDGKLRPDLRYRLEVFPIHVPPLRERDDDVLHLARHVLDDLALHAGRRKELTRDAERRLLEHDWPGNVRELRNVVERAYLLADEAIEADHVRACGRRHPGQPAQNSITVPLGASIREAERELVLATLAHHDGDKKRAAQTLGISLKTLYNRLNEYRGGGR